jgi:sugar phosphate isomerase/epimerase
MKLAFTTLGCPDWTLEQICEHGARHDYDAVDFRGYRDTLNLFERPEFTTDVQQTRRMLDDAGLAVSCISTSISLCQADRLDANLDEARRTMPIAQALGAGYLRVFGNGDVSNGHEPAAKIGIDTLGAILDLDGADQFTWLLETHDHWQRAADCRLIVDSFDARRVGVIWDIGVAPPEPHIDTYEGLKQRVRYVHLKDGRYVPDDPRAMKNGWRLVLPGQGEFPLNECIGLLQRDNFDGYVMFEHEKRWHPEIEEPAEALAHFAQWARSRLDR